MVVLDIADEIYRELNSPSDLSVPSIAFWLRGHIGDLNNLLSTSYEISTTDGATITPEINDNVKAIFKVLFTVYWYGRKIEESLGAAATDIMEITSDGGTVRKVNRNEISKSWLSLRKQFQEQLTLMLNRYNNNQASPMQVVGDDTISDDTTSTYISEPIRE